MFRFLRRHRSGFLLSLLILSVLGNIAAYSLLKRDYAGLKAAAVFPSHATHFREMNSALRVKTKKRIVLFGDSRIAQWKNFPESGNFEVIGRGINGETTAQMRTRFEQDVLSLDPDVVVLQLGINDLTALGVLPERRAEITDQCAANMRYFVDSLRARNVRTILLTIIPPRHPELLRLPVWSDLIADEVERLNRHWLEVPASPTLHVIDTRSLLQDARGRWRDNVNADTLHLTPQGYEHLNRAVLPLLQD